MRRSPAGTGGIKLSGIDDVLVRYAKVETLSRRPIIGFIHARAGVTCTPRLSKAGDTIPRRVEISWTPRHKDHRPVSCEYHRQSPGILATVGQTCSARNQISKPTPEPGRMPRRQLFTFDCSDLRQLKSFMRALQKVRAWSARTRLTNRLIACHPRHVSGRRTILVTDERYGQAVVLRERRG